jgi:adenylate kinase family enzyme
MAASTCPPLQRVLVIGTSGAGKSTFAARLAQRLGCPHVELDDLFWGPQWTPKPPPRFAALVAAAAAAERWVIDGNYSSVQALLWPRATQVVWLNYSRPRVMWRVLGRTLSRLLTGRELWHGNRETWRRAMLSRESILRWAWTTHAQRARRFQVLREEGAHPHLQWVELDSPRQAAAWLRSLPGGSAAKAEAKAEVKANTRLMQLRRRRSAHAPASRPAPA